MPKPHPIFRPKHLILLAAIAIIAVASWLIYQAQSMVPGNSDRYVEQFAQHLLAGETTGHAAPGKPTAWELAQQAIKLERDIRIPRDGAYDRDYPLIDYCATYRPADWLEDFDLDPFTIDDVVSHSLETMHLLREAGLFDLLARSAAAPRIGRPPYEAPLYRPFDPSVLEHSGAFRSLARLNNARLEQAARRGDWDDALDAITQGLALIRLDDSGSTLMSHLSASGQLSMLAMRIQSIAQQAPDEQTLRRIQSLLQTASLPSLARGLEGERLIALDFIERTYTDNGRGSGRFIPTAFDQHTWPSVAGPAPVAGPLARLKNLGGLVIISKQAAKDIINAYYDEVVELADLTLPERQAAAFDPHDFVDDLTWREVSVWFCLGGEVHLRSASPAPMFFHAAQLAVALELHRHRYGTYPKSLEELVPEFLESLPVDPASGSAYGYRLTEPSEDNDFPYLLYSFGADGQDNGGTPAARPSDALHPGEAPGADYILVPQD